MEMIDFFHFSKVFVPQKSRLEFNITGKKLQRKKLSFTVILILKFEYPKLVIQIFIFKKHVISRLGEGYYSFE
jgi:hypothetical protein